MIENLFMNRWVRTRTKTHPNKRNGAYFFAGGYGFAQNWSSMDRPDSWFEDRSKPDPDLLSRMERTRESHERRRFEDAIRAEQKASEMLSLAIPDTHPYLVSKGLPEVKGMVLGPILLVRMEDLHGRLVGLQTIELEEGSWKKRMLHGMKAKGAVLKIGTGRTPILCEGYATGLSIDQALKMSPSDNYVLVCFSAGNIVAVAKELKTGMVFADNDLSGAGQEAAEKSGLPWVMADEPGMDANDLMVKSGTVGVIKKVNELRRIFKMVTSKLRIET